MMSSPPKKLTLDFLLNEDKEAKKDDRSRRKKPSPTPPRSSSNPNSTHTASSARNLPTSSPTPAGASGSSARPSSHSKVFNCERCDKTFVERGNLNKHISSVHLKEKNKICPEPGCNKSFSFRDGLVRHIAHVHQNERLYGCGLCDKTFKQASHLSKHMRSIHKKH